jgi:tight adherence protein C
MNTLAGISLFLVPAVLIGLAWLLLSRLGTNRRSLERVFTEPVDLAEHPDADSAVAGWLRRWLFLAGYRQPVAPAAFVAAMLLAIGLGLAAALTVLGSGLTKEMFTTIDLLPPAMHDLVVPFAYAAPWIGLLILVLAPWMVVRRSRRQRVEKVEQDLPISLELLATLSEAGLGFDAALSRVLDSVPEDRPLVREFRSYQSDLLSGRTRVESLRRLARRLEVASVTILVSALVQAEQLGSGISQALRRQADDLRDRRRERATAFAMALPIKRMFPLVICFMPGIFVWTLGPALTRLFQVADTFMKVRNLH